MIEKKEIRRKAKRKNFVAFFFAIFLLGLLFNLIIFNNAEAEEGNECSACEKTELSLIKERFSGEMHVLEQYFPVVKNCLNINFSRNLRQGMSGKDVKCLQTILNLEEETQIAETGAGSPGKETEYFGSLTKNAVNRFQTLHQEDILHPLGLTQATGFAGERTRIKLNNILIDAFKQSLTALENIISELDNISQKIVEIKEKQEAEKEKEAEEAEEEKEKPDALEEEEEEEIETETETETEGENQGQIFIGGGGGANASDPEPECSADNLDLCDTEGECSSAELYWYEEACHIEPEPVLEAPTVVLLEEESVTYNSAVLRGEITSLGDYSTVEALFEWKEQGGTWQETTRQTLSSLGVFDFSLTGLEPGTTYEFRAVLKYNGETVCSYQMSINSLACRTVTSGSQTYNVTTKTNPKITQVIINPLDVTAGDSATVSVEINDEQGNPISAVEGEFILDETTTPFDLSLINGTSTNGTWQGEWTSPADFCRNYQLSISATSDSGTTEIVLTFL
jgi:hypothetical protein